MFLLNTISSTYEKNVPVIFTVYALSYNTIKEAIL